MMNRALRRIKARMAELWRLVADADKRASQSRVAAINARREADAMAEALRPRVRIHGRGPFGPGAERRFGITLEISEELIYTLRADELRDVVVVSARTAAERIIGEMGVSRGVRNDSVRWG